MRACSSVPPGEKTGILHVLYPVDIGRQLGKERRIEILVDVEINLLEPAIVYFSVLRNVRPAHAVLAFALVKGLSVRCRLFLVDLCVLRDAVALGEVHDGEAVARAVAHRRFAAAHRH